MDRCDNVIDSQCQELDENKKMTSAGTTVLGVSRRGSNTGVFVIKIPVDMPGIDVMEESIHPPPISASRKIYS